MERMTTRRPRRGGGEKASPAAEVTPARTELTVAPAAEVKLLVPVETPEPVFAARVPPPAPERRRPTTRHAIFFDVENTSHPAHIERVIERLRSEEHTSELQSRLHLVCRLLLEKKKNKRLRRHTARLHKPTH